MEQGSHLERIYKNRFDAKKSERKILWQTLCRYFFQKYIGKDDTVIDLPAGYCEFINNIDCGHKIAVDLNPQVKKMADKDVEVIIATSTKLPSRLKNTADVVFVSNFFEHLPGQEELLATLRQIHTCLKEDGKLIILQPNIRLVKGKYWDFLDHTLPLTEKTIEEALQITGYSVQERRVRFLPYTTDSKLPVSPLMIRLFLKFRPAQLLLGKQSLFVAKKRAE